MPRAWKYMLEAMLPKPSPSRDVSDRLVVEWNSYRPRRRDIDDFLRLCGLQESADRLPPLFLHAISFRVQMALLTRRAFPLRIWRVLQVRNRLVDLQPVGTESTLDFRCRVHAMRRAGRGIEVGLETCVESEGGRAVARSINTFYVRSAPGEGEVVRVPDPPAVVEEASVAWRAPRGGGIAFGRLTGDYNGIHLFDPYARLFGFRRAFLHPLRVVGQAIAHLPGEPRDGACTTDIWMRGPVFRDAEVKMRTGHDADGSSILGVHCEPDPRPAIVVRRGA